MLKDIFSNYPHVNSILINYNGKRLYETYNNYVDRLSLQNTACIFKGFLTALIGICVDNKMLSLDQTVVDLLGDNRGMLKNKELYNVTIEHILTKKTGLIWPPPFAELKDSDVNDYKILYSLDFKHKPGLAFEYKPDPFLLPFIIERVSGIKFERFLEKFLFNPLNINEYEWDKSLTAKSVLKLNSEDIEKLGLLYLNKGTYNNKSILSSSFITKAWSVSSSGGFPEFNDYGYYWWITELNSYKTYYCAGFGGQYLTVTPKKNLVCTITSQMNMPHVENLKIVKNVINQL